MHPTPSGFERQGGVFDEFLLQGGSYLQGPPLLFSPVVPVRLQVIFSVVGCGFTIVVLVMMRGLVNGERVDGMDMDFDVWQGQPPVHHHAPSSSPYLDL